jgi:hypothetical protein
LRGRDLALDTSERRGELRVQFLAKTREGRDNSDLFFA